MFKRLIARVRRALTPRRRPVLTESTTPLLIELRALNGNMGRLIAHYDAAELEVRIAREWAYLTEHYDIGVEVEVRACDSGSRCDVDEIRKLIEARDRTMRNVSRGSGRRA